MRVRIGGRELEAVAGSGTFTIRPGQVALVPGSSRSTGADGAEVRWAEVFLQRRERVGGVRPAGIGERVEVEGVG